MTIPFRSRRSGYRVRNRLARAACAVFVGALGLGFTQAASAATPVWTADTMPSGWSIPSGDAAAISCAPSTTHCVTAALGPSGWGVLVTSDLVTWTGYESLPSTFGSGDSVAAISCPTSSHCVAVGKTSSGSGAVGVSNDGGVTWTNATPSGFARGQWAWAVSCPSASNCFLVGGSSSPAAPVAAVSTNGGTSWTFAGSKLPSPTTYYLDGISCSSTTSCVAVGQFIGVGLFGKTTTPVATSLTTTNGGTSWTQASSSQFSTVSQMTGVSCVGGTSTCWASAILSGSTEPAVLVTQNEGVAWTKMSFTGGGGFSSVSCISAVNCWFGGTGSTLSLFGTDDGNTFIKGLVATTTNQNVTVSCPSLDDCAATAWNGLYVTTNDGGLSAGAPPPPTTGTIAGVVTGGGSSLAGICVDALSNNTNNPVSTTTTAGDGSYAMTLKAGIYDVEFDPSCDGSVTSSYAQQYYLDEPDLGSARSILVVAGQTTSGIDADLSSGATISGLVQGPGGAVGGTCVSAYSSSTGYAINEVLTADDGTYSIANLPADSYVVLFDPTCGSTQTSSLSVQWNGGSDDPAGASPIALSVGQTVANVDATLSNQAVISGTITADYGLNSADMCIDVIDAFNLGLVNFSVTDAGGNVAIGNLPAGSYVVGIDPTCVGLQASDYPTQYVGGSTIGDATVFSVGAGGVDSMSATIEPIDGPQITTSSLPGGTVGIYYFTTMAVTNGVAPYTWSATNLPAGLSIDPSSGDIYGTPSGTGSFSATIAVTDSSTPPVTASVSWNGSIAAVGGVGGTSPAIAIAASSAVAPKISVGGVKLSSGVVSGAHASTLEFSLKLTAKKGHPIPGGVVKVTTTKMVRTVVKVKGRSEAKHVSRTITLGSGHLVKGAVTIKVLASLLTAGLHRLTIDYVGNATYSPVKLLRTVKILAT